MMKNAEYWVQRFEVIEAAKNRACGRVIADAERMFSNAQRDLENQISGWYNRFAENNQISLAEARRLLNTRELAEFRWDVNDYIRHGEQVGLNPQWMRQLENASARVHVSRLEALKLQTQQTIETIFGNQLDNVDDLLKRQFLDGHYRAMFEIQRGFNIGWDVAAIDERRLERILSKPWTPDGRIFSDRIWNDKNRLLNQIHTDLTHNMILGKPPDHAIKNLANAMNTSKHNAGRLIMTESAYFSNLAQHEAFKELDVEQFEVVATLDMLTSAICSQMDGKVFPMSEYQIGVTAPPFHPWCRTVTAPYFDDDFGERAARDPDNGETHYVPQDMTYEEWKRAYVDKTETPRTAARGLSSSDDSVIIRESENLKLSDFPDAFLKGAERKNTQAFIDFVNDIENADPNSVALLARMGEMDNLTVNGIPFKISHGKNHAVTTSYSSLTGDLLEVKLNIPKFSGVDITGQVNTAIHEKFHFIDLLNRTDPKKAKMWFSEQSPSFKAAFEKSRTGMSQEITDLFAAHKNAVKQTWVDVNAVYKIGADKAMAVYKENLASMGWTKATKIRETELKRLKRVRDETADILNRNLMGGGVGNLEDIYDALSAGTFRDKGVITFGHGSKYYRNLSSQLHETFANYGALSVTRPDLVAMLRRDKPDLVQELDAMIARLVGR